MVLENAGVNASAELAPYLLKGVHLLHLGDNAALAQVVQVADDECLESGSCLLINCLFLAPLTVLQGQEEQVEHFLSCQPRAA